MRMCDDLRAAAQRKGQSDFVPIAGSQYSFDRFGQIYKIAMTAGYLDRLDVNLDGTVSQLEMDRDQAVFLFLQGHAAMIPTGSWDFSTLVTQATFDVAVTDFPLPSKSNPDFGPYVAGQPSEADTRGGFPFAITKTSPNRELALDFLRYAASLEANQKLNRMMYWLPTIIDPVTKKPKPRKELEPFTPRVEGYSNTLEFYGPNTKLAYDQQSPLYLSGDRSYEEFVERYMKQFRQDLPTGVDDIYRDMEQTLQQQLQFAALRRAALSGAPGALDALTGEPQTQLKRILEAYAAQRNARDHEIRVWVDNVKQQTQSER